MSAPRKSYRKGDPARSFSADDYNAIAAEVERWANLKAIAPLAIGDGPGGRYLTRDGEPSFYAKLSGASSPYAWTEQVETASGVWANGERTGTDAYEVNSRASLNNKIARLYPTAFDHRFRFIRAGGASAAGVRFTIGSVTFSAAASPLNYAGVAIDVYNGDPAGGGTVVETLTANASGVINVTTPSSGTVNRWFKPAGAFAPRWRSSEVYGPLTLASGDQVSNASFTASSAAGTGYNRHGLIGIPIKTTLAAISSALGSYTVTNPISGAPWTWGLNNSTGTYPQLTLFGANDTSIGFAEVRSGAPGDSASGNVTALATPLTSSTPDLLTITFSSTYGGTWTFHE